VQLLDHYQWRWLDGIGDRWSADLELQLDQWLRVDLRERLLTGL
jgi:hypothetical protein